TGSAVWTGIGAIGIAVLGIVLFSESTNPDRVLSIALIVVGIIGLKLTSGTSMAG
ncbi:MAG: SMR family transporter, partial [Pseudomonadota bacterium]|nr:SMR family transporter [Pseudomonadota bacterium]